MLEKHPQVERRCGVSEFVGTAVFGQGAVVILMLGKHPTEMESRLRVAELVGATVGILGALTVVPPLELRGEGE